MDSQISDGLYLSVSEFSETAEKVLIQIEKGDIKGKDNLRKAYNLHLSHFVRKDGAETDDTEPGRLITAGLYEMVMWNTGVAGDRLYASCFMHVHIEPILALANEYGLADLRTERDEIMMVYNFALGMRRLYRKMSN